MTTEGEDTALARVLDGMALMQGEIASLARTSARIEAHQKEILQRLDTIDAGQAAVGTSRPCWRWCWRSAIENRDEQREGFAGQDGRLDAQGTRLVGLLQVLEHLRDRSTEILGAQTTASPASRPPSAKVVAQAQENRLKAELRS